MVGVAEKAKANMQLRNTNWLSRSFRLVGKFSMSNFSDLTNSGRIRLRERDGQKLLLDENWLND